LCEKYKLDQEVIARRFGRGEGSETECRRMKRSLKVQAGEAVLVRDLTWSGKSQLL
jgi:hypothetical protein